jgi:type IV pilus assembly protein PilM
MNFLKLGRDAFGMDISDLSIKIAKLKKRGNFFKLASWGETPVKAGVIVNGEIMNEKEFTETIKLAVSKVKGKKIDTKDVIVSLPEKEAFIQVIKMPKMKEEELSAAVPFEAENYIPFELSEVYLDFQVVPQVDGHNEEQIDVMIAAVPRRIVDKYLECFKQAKLNPVAMEIESQSIARALIKNEVSPQPVLIIDFGRSRVGLLVYYGHSLVLTSSVEMPSGYIAEDLSKEFKVDKKEAEKMNADYGQPILKSEANVTREAEERVHNTIRPIIDNFVAEIKKYINYFETHPSGKGEQKIKKIILSGRESNIKNFAEYIAIVEETKIPVEFGNVWINILPYPLREVPEMPFEESLGYSAAFGLALRAKMGNKK